MAVNRNQEGAESTSKKAPKHKIEEGWKGRWVATWKEGGRFQADSLKPPPTPHEPLLAWLSVLRKMGSYTQTSAEDPELRGCFLPRKGTIRVMEEGGEQCAWRKQVFVNRHWDHRAGSTASASRAPPWCWDPGGQQLLGQPSSTVRFYKVFLEAELRFTMSTFPITSPKKKSPA